MEKWEVEELEKWKSEFNAPLVEEETLEKALAGMKLRLKVIQAIKTKSLTEQVNGSKEVIEDRIKELEKDLEELRAGKEYDVSKKLVEHIEEFKRKKRQLRKLTSS